MRDLGGFQHRIAFVKNEHERACAQGVIRRIMKIDPTPEQQQLLDDDPAGTSALAAAWRGDVIAATIACFPRMLPNGTTAIHIGQLCAESRETMKKRGAAVEALLWASETYLRDRGWWLVSGLFGRRLYEAYYRKLMGIGAVELATAECRRLDTRELAGALANKMPVPPLWLTGRRIGIDDGIILPCSLVFNGYGTTIGEGKTAPLVLRGTVWPLLRWAAHGRGKRDLIRALLQGNIRIFGWWRNPLFALRLGFFLWKMGCSTAASPKDE